jgi:hypothetical protein
MRRDLQMWWWCQTYRRGVAFIRLASKALEIKKNLELFNGTFDSIKKSYI